MKYRVKFEGVIDIEAEPAPPPPPPPPPPAGETVRVDVWWFS